MAGMGYTYLTDDRVLPGPAGIVRGRGYVKRLLVVTNASAGSADEERVEAALAVLRGGADVRVESCSGPDDLADLLGGRDGRTPLFAGGDGSVHTAVAALRGRGELSPDLPIGLLPMGTGNDLARTLGIPLDPAEAARALLSAPGRARSTWSSTTSAAWSSTQCTSESARRLPTGRAHSRSGSARRRTPWAASWPEPARPGGSSGSRSTACPCTPTSRC